MVLSSWAKCGEVGLGVVLNSLKYPYFDCNGYLNKNKKKIKAEAKPFDLYELVGKKTLKCAETLMQITPLGSAK
jgi:hypothetical protein